MPGARQEAVQAVAGRREGRQSHERSLREHGARREARGYLGRRLEGENFRKEGGQKFSRHERRSVGDEQAGARLPGGEAQQEAAAEAACDTCWASWLMSLIGRCGCSAAQRLPSSRSHVRSVRRRTSLRAEGLRRPAGAGRVLGAAGLCHRHGRPHHCMDSLRTGAWGRRACTPRRPRAARRASVAAGGGAAACAPLLACGRPPGRGPACVSKGEEQRRRAKV